LNPLLGLLGLAARAGALVAGTEGVRAEVRGGKVQCVLLASDAAAGQRSKLIPLLDARGVRHYTGFSRAELGRATGRAPTSAIGIKDAGFAQRAQELAASTSLSQH
jgi:ribosomal protein L7Ae-like RNA K-turn-binding protein